MSGAMPFAQWGLDYDKVAARPPSLQGAFGQSYPADFIAEGVDQTRGWFIRFMPFRPYCTKVWLIRPVFRTVW